MKLIQFLTALLIALVLPEAGANRPVGQEEPHFVILHTNDIHGQLEPVTSKNGKRRGGFLELEKTIRRQKAAETRPVLLLDAGDWFGGHPVSGIEADGMVGGAVVAMMNRLGYDAVALGNHELDFGQEVLAKLLNSARFPNLSANVRARGNTRLPLYPVKRFHKAGMKISVIGLTTDRLSGLISKRFLRGLEILPVIETAREVAKAEKALGADFIIALTHIGLEKDKRLAEEVEDIDLIIGGHSHSLLFKGVKAGGKYIAQAGSKGRSLGRVEVFASEDGLRAAQPSIIEVLPSQASPDPEMNRLVEAYSNRLEETLGATIGTLETNWERNFFKPNPMGQWLAAALAREMQADFGVLNSGGIRKNLVQGPITKKDIMEVCPFQNLVAVFECTGAEVLHMLEHNAYAEGEETHGILQCGNLEYRWQKQGKKYEVTDVKIAGVALDPERTYKVATSDYVVFSHAEKYLGFRPAKMTRGEVFVYDALISAVSKAKVIR